jgi:hypothetical protein
MPADSRRETHCDLIFGHAGDPRVAASAVLVGIVAVLIGSVSMAIGPPLKMSAPAARTASGESRSAPVRVVGATPGEEISCEQQTWPSIDQRCLVRMKVEPSIDSRSPVTQDDAKLSPLTATGTAMKSQPGARDVMMGGSPPDNPGTQPASPARDALTVPTRSDETLSFVNDETQDLPAQFPPEPARKRVRRHFGFPFGFRF